MKKFFLLALALCSLTAFAQTNLFDKSTATFESWFGDGAWVPLFTSSAEYDAATGAITCTLDQAPFGQWHAQLKLTHAVDFTAGNYYGFSCKFTSSAAANGITIKMDDNTAMLYADQSVNAPAGEFVFVDTVKCEAAGNNHILVFDLGNVATGTTVVISDIMIYEATAPAPKAFDGCGAEFVATSGNPAAGHDGNPGSRWESASKDPQYWQWNMAEAQTFNRIKIVWEGAYAKTFNIKAGDACDDLAVIASVEGQSLAGFPYTQIIELEESVTASSIQFEGLERGTNYGYSFWEFDVYEAQVSVLTSLDFSAKAAVAKVGATVDLTATPKDQYGIPMEETVTFSVEPATAGHVEGSVYTADAAGLATIIATCGELSKTVTIFNYAGENVALNKTATGDGANDIARVNDGNDGTEYQADSRNGGNPHEWDSEFVIDLAASYDLELVTIHFEGACSDAYTLETSADGESYNVAYSFSGTLGINNHTDFLFGEDLVNATDVRYLKFHSTKNATDWGCKIYELCAYGVEHTPTALPAAAINGKAVKLIENGNIVIIRDGVRYNAQGAKL